MGDRRHLSPFLSARRRGVRAAVRNCAMEFYYYEWHMIKMIDSLPDDLFYPIDGNCGQGRITGWRARVPGRSMSTPFWTL